MYNLDPFLVTDQDQYLFIKEIFNGFFLKYYNKLWSHMEVLCIYSFVWLSAYINNITTASNKKCLA